MTTRTNRLMILPCALACCLVLVTSVSQAQDQEPAKKTLVTNLENPSGIAIQPETGHVFIASRYGVYRYDPNFAYQPGKSDPKQKHKKIHIELANSTEKTDVYGKGPFYDIGPLGVAFMDGEHLVVGDGSRKDGDEFVRVYKIHTESGAHEPFAEDAAVHTLGPIVAEEGVTAKGEGNFYGVAVGAGAIFVTCNGDDTKGWVSKSDITDGKPGKLTPFIATKVATEVDAPVPITFSPNGQDLVVGQMGEMNVVPGDSLLTIYDPKTGELKAKYETGLLDLAGLAYSPKTGKLYGTDFAWAKESEGGLFELKIEGDAVQATKIVGLNKPAALAFDNDGKLYVTTFGTAEEGTDKSPGELIVFDAGL